MMETDIYKKLRDGIQANEPWRRYEAVILIGHCEEMLDIHRSQGLLDMLYPLLQDMDNHVRYYTIQAVGKFMDRESISYLKDSMKTLSSVTYEANAGITEAMLEEFIEKTIQGIEEKGNA